MGQLIKVGIVMLGVQIFVSTQTVAQAPSKMDSLRSAIIEAQTGKQRLTLLEDAFDYWIYKNYDSAYVYAQRYYETARVLKSREEESTGLTLMGWVYDFKGEIIQAKNYYEQALNMRRELDNQKLVANSLSNIGVMYYYASDFEQAVDYYLQAIKIRETIHDSVGLGQSYNNMGVVMRNQGEYEKAIEFYTKAAEVKRAVGDEYETLATLINIGTLYSNLGDYEKALSNAKNGLAIAQKYNDHVSEGQLLLNIGDAYTGLDQYAKAVQSIRAGIPKLEKTGEYGLAFEGYNMLLENYLQSEQFQKAFRLAQEMPKRMDQASNLEALHNMYALIARAYAQQGFYEQAFQYQQMKGQLQDSLFKKSSRDAMLELEAKYEVDKKEQELELLSAQNALKEARLTQSVTVRNYLILLTVITLIALGFVYQNYRKRKSLSETLARQNEIINQNLEEKELLIKEIHHRVKNNLQIISSLLNIQSKQSTDESASSALQESKNRVQSMAMIHQRLYQNEHMTSVYMPEYIENLVQVMIRSYGKDDQINLELDIEELELDVDTTIPLALILNELIANAMQHAFRASTGQNHLSIMLRESDQMLLLTVRDNGPGIPRMNNQTDHFGLQLIQTLSQKLEAEVAIHNKNGAEVILKINKYQKVV